jgi:hypothetical protein
MNIYGFQGALIPNLLSELDTSQYIDVYRCTRCIDFYLFQLLTTTSEVLNSQNGIVH